MSGVRLANETHFRITLLSGGTQDGTPTYSGTPLVLECTAEDFADNINAVEREVTARCDTETLVEQIRTTRELSFTVRVPVATGLRLKALMGNYIRATIQAVGGLSGTAETLDDLAISTYTHASPAQGLQTERVTLKKVAV